MQKDIALVAASLEALAASVKASTEDQKGMAEDQQRMAEDQRRMAEDQRRMAEHQKRMAEDQKRMAARLEQIAARGQVMEQELQDLKGTFASIGEHLVRLFERDADIRAWRETMEARVEALEKRQPPAA